MNSFIENLNGLGADFLRFAGPMLWQSSLLIAFVFALDFLLARKIRASVRYALWLAVLVKLLLPPALALPTGAAWWLFPAKPPMKAPAMKNYVVTYDTSPPPVDFPAQTFVMPEPPAPKLNVAGWALLASMSVSAGLLLWLALRWRQVNQTVRRASISENILESFVEARQSAKLRSSPRLKISDNRMSPAVCGLFRPVILLPRALAEKLSPAQLRAVLLHELFHLRRRDVWVNCAQALLQIFYWWHPLLWLANARIRRLREEAVDDAVMLALRDEADSYAPTLLEVAKLAFRRPLMSLGLVGIMESRSALRQRIERLVDFRAPRKAGLTFVSLCGIFVFSAVALPMGEAPAAVEPQTPGGAAATGEEQTLTVKVDPGIFLRNVKAQAPKTLLAPADDYTAILLDLLRSEGVDSNPPHGIAFNTVTGEITTQNSPDKLKVFQQVIEQLSRADGICELPLRHPAIPRKQILIEARIYSMNAGEFEKLTAGLHRYAGDAIGAPWWSVPPEQFKPLVAGIEADGLQPLSRPRILTSSGMPASMFIGDDKNGIQLDCKPFAGDGFVDLTLQNTVISGVPDHAATNQVASKASAENHGGVVLRMENSSQPGSSFVTILTVEMVTNSSSSQFQQRLVPLPKPASAATASSAQELVGDGKLLFEMGKLDAAQTNLEAALAIEPQNATAKYYLALIQTNRQNQKLVYTGPGRQQIVRKLQSIRLDRVSFDGLPLSQVLRLLNEEARKRDDEHKGINFLINSPKLPANVTNFFSSQPPAQPAIDPATGLPVLTTANASPDLMTLPITLRPALNNATLSEVLDALVKASPSPIYYSVQDFAIVFSPGKEAELMPFGFKVDVHALDAGLTALGKTPAGSEVERFKSLFEALGINWQVPMGKSVFYNDSGSQVGLFSVTATKEDLDTIRRAMRVLYQAQTKNAPNGNATNTGVMSDPNFRNALRALQQRSDTSRLSEPEVTTSSGRGVNRIVSPPIYYSPTRTNIVAKLDHIHLKNFSTGVEGKPLREVLAQLNEESNQRDPERKGIEFVIYAGGTNTVTPLDIGAVIIKIPNLTDVRLADVLDAIVLVAEHPIKYSIRDSGVVFSAKGSEKPQLFQRTFKVDPNVFYSSLRNVTDYDENKHAAVGVVNAYAGATNSGDPFAIDIGDGGPGGRVFVSAKTSSPTMSELARKFFTALGINLQEPPGKAVFYKDRLGILFVKATESDLDTIERAIQVLNQVPPQLHIKARFWLAPKGTLAGMKGSLAISNSAAENLVGILTDANARVVMQALQQRAGVEILGEPEVTTLSGRLTQMRATELINVVTNFIVSDHTNQDGTVVANSVMFPQTEKVEVGQVIDVVPYVLADGYTINLALIPSLTEFLGYATPTNTVDPIKMQTRDLPDGSTMIMPSSANLPALIPIFKSPNLVATVNLWDNQTAVLGGLKLRSVLTNRLPKVGDVPMVGLRTNEMDVLVFVTATIVDPAGNRVHTDDELPFAQKGVPTQPPQSPQPK